MQSTLIPALFTGGGGSGSGSLGAGWQAYDATTLEPKLPYLDVRMRNLTVTGTANITSTTTSTGQFIGGAGTKTAPSYSFTGDLDNGLYLKAANNPAISAGDTLIMDWSTTLVTSAMPLQLPNGTAAVPALQWTGFATSGFRLLGQGTAFVHGGVTIFGSDGSSTMSLDAIGQIAWYSGDFDGAIGSIDTRFGRSAAAVVGLYGASSAVGSSLALASAKQIQWSSTTDPDGAYDNAILPVGAAVLKPITASAAAGDWQAPKSLITAGGMTQTATVQGLLRLSLHKFSWTNAMVVALGAALTGDVTVGTLPAKFVVTNVYYVVTGQAAGVTTLTGAVGRTGAGYIDYVVASDLKAAANTMYGVTDATRGTNQTPTKAMDLPSYTATTDVKMHFISTVENLDQTTGSTGDVYIEGYVIS